MAVVAVWGQRARERAQARLPSAKHCVELTGSAVAVDTEKAVDGRVRIGQIPTCSSITATDRGLVLERGASWTAPIYYRRDTAIASSHLAPLTDNSDALDPHRLASMVGYAVQRDEGRSVYAQVGLVRPYETVVLHEDRVETTRRPTPELESISKRADIDALALELRRRLIASVKRASGDRRVAVMLSGGLDSSSVLAALLASRGANSEEIVEVTLDFEAPGSDQPHVRAIEKHYGITVSRVRPAEAPTRETLILDAAPSRHHGDPWVVACARRAHELGAELLLTGTGGDQFFGGDLGMAAASGLSQGDLKGTWDAVRAKFPHRASARHRLRTVAAAILRPHVPGLLRQYRARKSQRSVPAWAGPMLREEIARVDDQTMQRRASNHPQSRFDDMVLNPADSEYGAEARAQTDTISPIPRADPLYDDELVHFLMGVRHQALFDGGTYRGLLRRAMRGLLPESVRMRLDKSDFEPALAEAFWPIEDLEPLLTFASIGKAGIVDAPAFRQYLEPLFEAPRDGNNGSRWLSFWPALASEAFLRSRSP
jgi:asparagine synthase (glutamine-hydrolysing)